MKRWRVTKKGRLKMRLRHRPLTFPLAMQANSESPQHHHSPLSTLLHPLMSSPVITPCLSNLQTQSRTSGKKSIKFSKGGFYNINAFNKPLGKGSGFVRASLLDIEARADGKREKEKQSLIGYATHVYAKGQR